MHTTYRSGEWFLLVTPDAIVALPPQVPADVVTALWDRMPQHPTLATVLESVGAGGDFTALPAFVAVLAEGTGVRIALRGDVGARVTTASGPQEFSGADLTTWSERLVAVASAVELTLESVAPTSPVLPVGSGVVRASMVSAELASGQPPMTSAEEGEQPASSMEPPAALPVPEPEPEARPAPEPTPEPAPRPEPQPAPAARPEPEPAAQPEPEPAAQPEPESAAQLEPEPEPMPAIAENPQTAPVEVTLAPPNEMTLAPPVEATLAPSKEDFDQLWGATIHSAPSATPPTAPPAPAAPERGGDHDGETISTAAMRALRQQGTPAATGPDSASAPAVSAGTGASWRATISPSRVSTAPRKRSVPERSSPTMRWPSRSRSTRMAGLPGPVTSRRPRSAT